MNIIFFVFYAIAVITIIANVLKLIKAIKGNNNMFDNINNMINERYNRTMQNNIFEESNKITSIEKEVNLDDFLKSNTNPVKEKRSKRSKI